MYNIVCFVDIEKDDYGLWHCGQSLEIAYMRSYFKEYGVRTLIYIEDLLPSLADLAEEVLSMTSDIIVFNVNEINWKVVYSLVEYINSIEDVSIILIGDNERVIEMEGLGLPYYTDKPEKSLLKELDIEPEEGKSIYNTFPYESEILSPYDAKEYGIWIGRDGEENLRDTALVECECSQISNVLKDSKNINVIKFVGNYISNSGYVLKLIEEVKRIAISQTIYVLPIEVSMLSDLKDNIEEKHNIIFDINVTNIDDEKCELISLFARGNLLNELNVDFKLIISSPKLNDILKQGAGSGKFTCSFSGKVDFSKVEKPILEQAYVKKSLAKQVQVFTRGYLRSRTGMYNGVKLDGYVKHIEIDEENFTDETAEYMNEIASVNSSIYIRGMKSSRQIEHGVFDQNHDARINDKAFEWYSEKMHNNGTIPSNLITISDEKFCVNDSFYFPKQSIKEKKYSQIKEELLKGNCIDKQEEFYIYVLDSEQEYKMFLSDAQSFYDNHRLINSPLLYGYLRNYCMFMNYKCCCVDKIPRIKIGSKGNLYVCSDFKEPIGKIGQTIFELNQNGYVRKERMIKERNCSKCKANSWCSKCTHMPEFIQKDYCDIMVNRPYITDYVMASCVLLQLITTSKMYKGVDPSEMKISSEYMYNIAADVRQGEENPYFPKYTYIFNCHDNYSFWSATRNTFISVSKPIVCVMELLLKRLSIKEILSEYSKIMSVSLEEADKVCNYIFDKFNKAGVLYRMIRGE